jgi:hypothetical protein
MTLLITADFHAAIIDSALFSPLLHAIVASLRCRHCLLLRR